MTAILFVNCLQITALVLSLSGCGPASGPPGGDTVTSIESGKNEEGSPPPISSLQGEPQYATTPALRERVEDSATKLNRVNHNADDKSGKDKPQGPWQVVEIRRFEVASEVVAFSRDGKQVICISGELELTEWEIGTGKQVRHSPAQDNHKLIATSPDFQFGLSAQRPNPNSLGQIHLWDFTSGISIRSWAEPAGQWDTYGPMACLSRDAALAVALYEESSVRQLPGGNVGIGFEKKKEVFIWDGQTGQAINPVTIHAEGTIAVSPNRQWFITDDEENNVLIWDAETGNVERKLLGSSGSPVRLHASSGGFAVCREFV